MVRWQLQLAKAQFSEVVRRAVEDGPQEITVHGASTAVLLSKPEFDRLVGTKETFNQFLDRSPLKGLDLDLQRDKSTDRAFDL